MKERNEKIFTHLFLFLVAFTGAMAVSFLTGTFGSGMTADSAVIVSLSRQIAAGKNLLGEGGIGMLYSPPVYPALLAVVKLFSGADPIISSGYINAVLFGLTIYLSGLMILKYTSSIASSFIGAAWILISYALLKMALVTLTETLFIFFTILHLYFIEYYNRKRSPAAIVLLSVTIAFACLTRYIGIVLVFSGFAGIYPALKNNWRKSLRHVAIFITFTLILPGLWIVRNLLISDTLTGERAPSSYSLIQNVVFYLKTVTFWFFNAGDFSYFLMAVILLLLFTVSVYFAVIKFRKNEPAKIFPVIVFIVVYSLLIIISSTFTAYDRISHRLLSPVYIPLIFLFLYTFIESAGRFSNKMFRIGLTILLFTLSFFTIKSQTIKSTALIQDFEKKQGWGYSNFKWKQSETLQYLRKMNFPTEKFSFFSNDPYAINLFTGYHSRRSPARKMYNSPKILRKAAELDKYFPKDRNIILVWFYDTGTLNYLFPPDSILANTDFREKIKCKDGIIYSAIK